jgi:Wzt-like putative exopolysaccharide export protein
LTDGIPLVFVSHNLAAVVDLCRRAIFIDRGRVQFDGPAAAAVAEFRAYRPDPGSRDGAADDRPVRITNVRLLHGDDTPSLLFATGRRLVIEVAYSAARPIKSPQVAIDIHNSDGVFCAGINTGMDNCDLGTIDGVGVVELVIPRLWLLPGAYTISVGIHESNGLHPYDLHMRAYPFSVISDRRDFGVVYLEHDWRTRSEPIGKRSPQQLGSFAASPHLTRSSVHGCATVPEERP